MDRPQLIRRLRIAVSVFFAVVTLAFWVLWVRSHWRNELVLCSVNQHFILVDSHAGALGFSSIPEESIDPWTIYSLEGQWRTQSWSGFQIDFGDTPSVATPYWFWLLIPVALAVSPWLLRSRRFSLRTLLIVTTLVAVVLGLGVWAVG